MRPARIKLSMSLLPILFLAFLSSSVFAQNEPIGNGFSKSNRKSIEEKMKNLMKRVSEEMQCPLDSISYTVLDKYTTFYSKESRHLPEVIQFKGCGKTMTYKHNGLSGAVLYWLLGSWVQVKEKDH